MRWRHVKTIFLKEMKDTVRDRRTLSVMIIVPLVLMPLMMFLGPALLEREEKKTKEAVYKVVVLGKENSKGLTAFLKRNPRLDIIESSNPDAQLKDGKIHTVISIPKGFDRAVKLEKKAQVEIRYEGTEKLSEVAKLQVNGIINEYAKQEIGQRLAKRSLTPDILEPFDIKEHNVASDEEMGGMFLSFIVPFVIVIWAVMGGMYTAIDMGAGEKERGTLEALLVTPPARKAVVLGKFLAILTVATVAIALALFSMVIAFKFLLSTVIQEVGSQTISLPAPSIALILLLALLIASFLSALQLAVSAFARSFKEAQNYITPLYLVSFVPMMAVQFMQSYQPPVYMFLVPIMNAMLVFRELFLGDINWQHVGLVAGSSAIMLALALAFAFRTFSNEKVLFRT